MSHRANHELSSLPSNSCNGSGFRVLFHLCDSHNSMKETSNACFPSQKRLMERTGLSNGGLNKVLNQLERDGLIERIKGRMDNGHRQQTRYILWFDKPTPQSGEGENHLHSGREPSPLPAQNHLHLSGEEYVRGTGKITGKSLSVNSDDCQFDEFWEVSPRKVGKVAAKKAWGKAIKKANPEAVIAAMSDYAKLRKGENPKYTVHPATWLNEGRWDDELPPASSGLSEDEIRAKRALDFYLS